MGCGMAAGSHRRRRCLQAKETSGGNFQDNRAMYRIRRQLSGGTQCRGGAECRYGSLPVLQNPVRGRFQILQQLRGKAGKQMPPVRRGDTARKQVLL